MESNRKHRGFIKSKLTPFYRAAKPALSAMPYTTKVKPNQASSTTASVSFHDYKISQPKQVSFFVPAADKKRENLSQIDTFFGFAGDEAVDIKASTYISSVQERFKLERNSEQVMLQETHKTKLDKTLLMKLLLSFCAELTSSTSNKKLLGLLLDPP